MARDEAGTRLPPPRPAGYAFGAQFAADTYGNLTPMAAAKSTTDSLGQADLTNVGWTPSIDLAREDWLRIGSRIGAASRNAPWWIGDWVRYGAQQYGSKYELASRVTGYDAHTLMNMVYVATRFDLSRRREELSWSHHAELAPLDEREQDRWLKRAASEKLSVRGLRLALLRRGSRTRTAR